MAFPTVATSATSKETAYGTSDFVVTLPTGVASGDLLLLYIIYNVAADRTYVTPSGWTRVARLFGNSAFESYIYGRFATGAESTATFTKTREAGGTGGGAGAAIAYRITGHYSSGTVADAVEATLAGSDRMGCRGHSLVRWRRLFRNLQRFVVPDELLQQSVDGGRGWRNSPGDDGFLRQQYRERRPRRVHVHRAA